MLILSNLISQLPGVLESVDRTSSYTFEARRQVAQENSLQTRIARLATDSDRLDDSGDEWFDACEHAVPDVSPQSLTASGYSSVEIDISPCRRHRRGAFPATRPHLFIAATSGKLRGSRNNVLACARHSVVWFLPVCANNQGRGTPPFTHVSSTEIACM